MRYKNTATVSSDEEEDLERLTVVESKLLAYDPTFTAQQTHASIARQRSALISAFRPLYEEGDVEGPLNLGAIPMTHLSPRQSADTCKC